MQWILIGSSPGNVHEYHLLEGGKVKLILKYSPSQQSARIFFDGKQRLVFLEKSGFWNHGVVFKNEYGIQLGKISFEKWHSQHSGIIEIEGKKYHHTRSNNSHPEVVIYEKDVRHPLLTCNINNSNANAEPSNSYYQQDEQEYTGLMVGLCWQLFMPKPIKHSLELPVQSFELSVA
jgi:hypothetical protein